MGIIFQYLPIDILNKIAELLEYKFCLVYFRLSKRFYSLNTDLFWDKKIERDFNMGYRTYFYNKNIYKYVAHRYYTLWKVSTFEINIRMRNIEKQIKREKEPKTILTLLKNLKHLRESITEREKELNYLSNILIKYLKKTYPNSFRIVYTNYPVENKLYTKQHQQHENLVTGKERNLVINTDGSFIQAGFFINNDEIQFKSVRNYFDIKFPSSFHKFMEDLGLEIKDAWKLYDIPDDFKYNSVEKFDLPHSQMATISYILSKEDMPFILFHETGRGIAINRPIIKDKNDEIILKIYREVDGEIIEDMPPLENEN